VARLYARYLLYILRHKWFVFLECWKVGLFWRGLTHDLSKFSPAEFGAYARYFFDGKRNKLEFDLAWLHHQRCNDHHWNWWVDGAVAWEMSEEARAEMICDWRAMGRAFGDTAQSYYLANREKIILAPRTRLLVEIDLEVPCG
jgi:hypothetical protein